MQSLKDKCRQENLASLEPLLQEAEKKGFWMFLNYQELWIHPRKLREAHAKGSFVFGSVNWSVRDPQERVENLLQKIKHYTKELNDFAKELKETSNLTPDQ